MLNADPRVAAKYPLLMSIIDDTNKRFGVEPHWEQRVYPSLYLKSAMTDKLIWEFTVERAHCNSMGILHGGCVTTIVDECTGLCIAVAGERHHQWEFTGVSASLAISCLQPIKEGQTGRVVCKLLRQGKTLANVHAEIYDENDHLCYTGSHTIFRITSKI